MNDCKNVNEAHWEAIHVKCMLKWSHLRKARTPEEKSPRITKGHFVKPVAADIQIDIEMPEPKA